MKHTLSVTVENEPGVLTRIASLFARRGFNIESLAVGQSETIGVSRITMVVPGNYQTIEQVVKQLYKLVNVIEIKNLSLIPSMERELMLIKIATSSSIKPEILQIANVFRAKVIDFSETSLTLEITGDSGKIAAIEKVLKKYKIMEIVRTGKISLKRESNVNSEFLKKSD